MVSAPVRSLMQPCQRFLIKAQDYGHRKINNKTKDQQTLYEKGAGRESRDDLRHLIAVEDGGEEATQQDIEATSRVFNVKPEEWLK